MTRAFSIRWAQAVVLSALVLLTGSTALAQSQAQEPAASSPVEVWIKGMACPFCVFGVEKHLGRIPGIRSVAVDLGKGRAALKLDPGAQITDQGIRKAVRDAGFTAGDIRRLSDASLAKTSGQGGSVKERAPGPPTAGQQSRQVTRKTSQAAEDIGLPSQDKPSPESIKVGAP